MFNSFSFLGNVGGYLGLFLGYALLNVPELFQRAMNWLHTSTNEVKNEAKKTSTSATK